MEDSRSNSADEIDQVQVQNHEPKEHSNKSAKEKEKDLDLDNTVKNTKNKNKKKNKLGKNKKKVKSESSSDDSDNQDKDKENQDENSNSSSSDDIFDEDILDRLKQRDELKEFIESDSTAEKPKKAVYPPALPVKVVSEEELAECSILILKNMQWDVLTAEDIMFMLHSFTPETGKIIKIEVWSSM